MKNIFNNRGEGYIDTGIKIIVAIVIGGLILAGLYLMFSNDGGVIDQLKNNIEGMMEYEGGNSVIRTKGDSDWVTDLQYSEDGIRWKDASVPSYSGGAVIEMIVSNGQIHCAVVSDYDGVYIMSSVDNGATWEHRRSWDLSYRVTISWDEKKGYFSGDYRRGSMYQPIVSDDGITWKNHGTPWDML